MSYTPATDFVGLWRKVGGAVGAAEMPGLDFVVAALVRAGVLVATFSGTAPTADQPTTAWFKPAVPSYSTEGALFLWDSVTDTYEAATPRLFFEFLQTSATQNKVSWWTVTGGAPANTVGKDGDLAIRTDGVGGIYGPKAFGAWPADPLPGTTNTIDQSAMDATFGAASGSMIVRTSEWVPLLKGTANQFLAMDAGATVPTWRALSALLDAVFGDDQGSVLFRGAASWEVLAPGAEDRVLTTHGAATDPSWTAKSSEFTSGTVMLFHQTDAPLGWVKSTVLDNYGLRVVNGVVADHAGSAFSTVFAQTAVGNTTLGIGNLASHGHANNAAGQASVVPTGSGSVTGFINSAATISNTGGDVPHTHSINLALAYTDVIIATKS